MNSTITVQKLAISYKTKFQVYYTNENIRKEVLASNLLILIIL